MEKTLGWTSPGRSSRVDVEHVQSFRDEPALFSVKDVKALVL